MRLTELSPSWLTGKVGDEDGGKRGYIGISFVCPHCLGNERPRRLAVLFDPPIDDGCSWLCVPLSDLRWERTGETFDDLTLSPSIDTSASGHWHGFITNGDVK